MLNRLKAWVTCLPFILVCFYFTRPEIECSITHIVPNMYIEQCTHSVLYSVHVQCTQVGLNPPSYYNDTALQVTT